MAGFSIADLSAALAYGVAFAAGIALHLVTFRVGEWDIYSIYLIQGTVLLDGLAALALKNFAPQEVESLWDAFKIVSLLLSACIAGIYTSLLIYRAAFHRLNRFPGPFAARLSNFYITSRAVKKFHLYEEIQDLHRQYGDIVRVGPSELSIADPKAFNIIHSNQSSSFKGPWYSLFHPSVSLHTVRDHKDHARRRKVWDKGFAAKALRYYEPGVAEYTRQLLHQINESEGKAMNVSTWFNFYSFDVMGDLAFGKKFNMLKDGIVHYYMESVHKNMLAVGALSHLVWMFPILLGTPGLNNEHNRLQKWLAHEVDERRKRKPETPDIYSWILEEYEAVEKPTKQETLDIYSDAHLIVIAGSDTTAAALTCLFFELAYHPEAVKTLREEIDQYYAENDEPSAHSFGKLEYLQACINESLRLHPAVPSGVQRQAPPEGMQLGDVYIPGNTIIQTPTWTLHRDERSFVQPNEFIPERWTSKPELVKNAAVFSPFLTGRYSCVGKQLGLMELRYVASEVIHRFDVAPAAGQTSEKFLDGLKDTFTLSLPELNLVFQPREK
ncbi:Cytochrome P450 monooxygenase FCK2 [Cladobotryum mycophilum]|uniref:Cytochrome P450 monooxygenase FCK2 n=1 Tax=Cladobotryum mycophilum TaxID=491253 RepID=A0ABR0S7Y9_9HYPO